MSPSDVHALWRDWCAVTGVALSARDATTLDRFRRQAGASRRSLQCLGGVVRPGIPRATAAWPRGHTDAEPLSLAFLLQQISTRLADPTTLWIDRLRLMRLAFAGVLLAPRSEGGLGLTRDGALALTPARLRELRPRVSTADGPDQCPACAVWAWLQVLGTNANWSATVVRALARDVDPGDEHCHVRPDPSPAWQDWVDHPNLLPAIDRWGYVNRYDSMHRSSLSVLVDSMSELLHAPLPAQVAPSRAVHPRRDPELSLAEQDEILARADAVNAQLAALLAEFE